MFVADRRQQDQLAAAVVGERGSHHPIAQVFLLRPVAGGIQSRCEIEKGPVSHRDITTRPRAVVALAAVAVMFLAGCGHDVPVRSWSRYFTPAHTSAVPSGGGVAALGASVEVASAFTEAMLNRSYKDDGPTAVLDHAAPYMTHRLATRLRRQYSSPEARADWDALVAARTSTSVQVASSSVELNKASRMGFSLAVHEVTVSAGGDREEADRKVAVVLNLTGNRWLVDRTDLEDES